MDKLKYKTFVWPHNPTVYKEEYLREPQYYKGDDGEYYFDAMGDEKLTITGTGAFFGDDAFVQFKKLAKLFKETTPGNLEHPIWGIRYYRAGNDPGAEGQLRQLPFYLHRCADKRRGAEVTAKDALR